jgi:hypothetical protein
VVRPDGTLAFTGIREVLGTPEDGPAWRLLTGVGDILLPEGVHTITREGPLTGTGIWQRVRRGTTVRSEVLSPVDLPIESAERATQGQVHRSCLAAFSRPIIRIPRTIAVKHNLNHRIGDLLIIAGVKYRRVETDRWLVFVFEPVTGSAPRLAGGYDDEARALLTLTAWESGDPPISRTSLEDCAIRRRLLASLASARRPFEVRWAPSYFPVEGRIQVLPDGERRPFVPVHAVFHQTVPLVRLALASRGHLVVGLALMGPGAA